MIQKWGESPLSKHQETYAVIKKKERKRKKRGEDMKKKKKNPIPDYIKG
jgi:hypothetical protein